MGNGDDCHMSQQPKAATGSLFERDEMAWLEQTATLLAQQRFGEVDCVHLCEYLAESARCRRRQLLRRLTALLVHMLMWDHKRESRTKSLQYRILSQRRELQDVATIQHERKRLRVRLDNPALEHYARQTLPRAYRLAAKKAALEAGVCRSAFPAACPWSLTAIVQKD
jgi:hypothetical protein